MRLFEEDLGMKHLKAAMAALVISMAPVMAPGHAAAQAMTDAESTQLTAFSLDSDLLGRLIGATGDFRAAKIGLLDGLDFAQTTSLAQLVTHVEGNPAAVAILQKHGLSAHDYFFGMLAIADARAAAAPQATPEEIGYSNPGNIAFYKAHLGEIESFLAAQ